MKTFPFDVHTIEADVHLLAIYLLLKGQT